MEFRVFCTLCAQNNAVPIGSIKSTQHVKTVQCDGPGDVF